MTPTEQDEELREEIKNILNAESFVSVDLNKVTPALQALVAKRYDNGAIDNILKLITADRKRVASSIVKQVDKLFERGNVYRVEWERLASDIEAQQEEV